MFISNPRHYPKFLVDVVKQENANYSKGDADYSVTELIGSPLPRILAKRHEHELTVDIDKQLFMFFGSMAHAVMERAKMDYVKFMEKRMFVKIGDKTVSGQLDVVYEEDGKLRLDDVKFCGKKHNYEPPLRSWIRQANAYRYMLHKTEGILVDELGILAFFRNSTMFDAKCKRLPIKPFALDKVEEYLGKQVALHVLCDSDLCSKIPECTPDDRWCTPEHWVIKGTPKAKSCLPKTQCDSEEDAVEMLSTKLDKYPDAIVEHRPETNMKCDQACSVANYCWFYQDYKQGYETNSYNLNGDETPRRKKREK